MGHDVAALLEQALKLPSEARAELADSLIDSLDAQTDPDAEDAWRQEVATRVQQLNSGTAATIAWDEVRRQLRSQLKP